MDLIRDVTRKAVFRMLAGVRSGHLELACADGTFQFGDKASDLRARIDVHNERFFQSLVFGGDDGAGDSFVAGDWSSPDLVSVVRFGARNLETLEKSQSLASIASRSFHRFRHLTRHNSRTGSQKNIQAHYDLSNDFFRLFLDEAMVYSSAVYKEPTDTLEDAQIEKLDRICRKLKLHPSDHLLEIGTGWGAFALHAARKYGCRVTTTTISREQHDLAKKTFAGAGEAGSRIELLLKDYRDLQGSFTKAVSIEMFEAVGLQYYDQFFSVCDRVLAPNGVMALQIITMNEQRFDAYKNQSDWIQRRIFPGAQLASLREVLSSLARATQLAPYHLEDIGWHYARTLAEWRRRFHGSTNKVRSLGFDDRFCRTWDYYLAYCEAAFLERHISDVQLLLTKNGNAAPLLGEPVEWGETAA